MVNTLNNNMKCKEEQQTTTNNKRKPNIIIILADDLGFSDVGCFGSEISTPNIDSLAYNDGGIRFTQMYNCARCCPSRASLLTGKYPHQAGIGHMVYDAGVGPEYQGYLRNNDDDNVATMAEMLQKQGGYATFMSGKWHVGGEYPPDASDEWVQSTMGDDTHPIPTQRGFDKFYGTLGGGGSYYQPPSLVRNDKVVPKEDLSDGYYYTDAINDEACNFIESMISSSSSSRSNLDGKEEAKGDDQPFFLYVSHTAPHWPLHAPKDDVDKYRGKYMQGWDKVRENRHKKLIQQGIIASTWECSPRHEHSPPWDDDDENKMSAKKKEWEDSRMATYAAQIEIMDRGIGRIIDELRKGGNDMYENTVIFFLSDNGGCAEYLKENGDEGHWCENYGGITRKGKQIQVGNTQDMTPGEEETFMSYGLSWANASNTPFRLFKSFVHEGGIATPFIVHWPAAMSSTTKSLDCIVESNKKRICHSSWILMDIVATCCDLAGIRLDPDMVEGESFMSILHGNDDTTRTKPIFWEHQGNRAVRFGKWKLVHRRCENDDDDKCATHHFWELYNMDIDRTELNNIASLNMDVVKRMTKLWTDWALRVGVKPWPLIPLPEGERDWSNVPWLW